MAEKRRSTSKYILHLFQKIRYEIQAEIGSGTFGKVFKVIHSSVRVLI